ncbi:SDR family oxidoreductase [Bacteroidota bacterium]
MLENLNNKTCVITGGAGVIGLALAKGIAKTGANIVLLDLNENAAKTAANEIEKSTNSKAIGLAANVLEKDSLINAREQIIKKFNKIDFLINCAGGNSPKATTKAEVMTDDTLLEDSFFGLSLEGFDFVFDLNFKGTVIPTMVFAEGMINRKDGAIINISSMNSYSPLTKIPAYSAAKSSINNFTQWLAVHFAKMGVRVNAIAPGFFLTNQNRFLLTDEKTGEPTPRGNKIIQNTPMGRYGEVDELAGTAVYLLSDMSKFITGIIIPVDGGYSAFGGV